MRVIPSFIFAALSFSALADNCEFLPKNNLKIPITIKNQGISEEEYHTVINKVLTVYGPTAARSGNSIQVNRLWESERVNAGTLKEDNNWVINLYGGFARHRETTADGYALVICHEIGHHIGGAPKKVSPSWSSNEGQADYFATLKCLRNVFEKDDNIEIVKDKNPPEIIKEECSKSFTSEEEVALCIRSSLAGIAISKVSADVRQEVPTDITITDPNVVTETFEDHPLPQCRLDTYFSGAICEVSSRRLLSRIKPEKGTCHIKNGHERGRRPLCWFLPEQ